MNKKPYNSTDKLAVFPVVNVGEGKISWISAGGLCFLSQMGLFSCGDMDHSLKTHKNIQKKKEMVKKLQKYLLHWTKR